MDLMTVEEVSAYLRVPEPTIRYWRHRSEGPPSFRLGRRVMFRRADVDAWVQAQIDAETKTAV